MAEGDKPEVMPVVRESAGLERQSSVRLIILPSEYGSVQFTSSSLQIYEETKRTVQDMSQEHALAVREVARLQHAVPAEQRTQRSKQQTVRQAITAGVVLVGFYALYVIPSAGIAIVGLVTVLGGGLVFGEYFNREKKQSE